MHKEVNAELFVFLMNNETGLYGKGDKEVIAYVHIDFSDLREFIEIVGEYYFAEGGMEVTLLSSTVAVDLNEIIENDGHYLSAYKKCFDEDDWEHYEKRIVEMEVA